MLRLFAIYKRHQAFFIPLLLFWGLGIILVSVTEQWPLFKWFNQWHHPVADIFFKYATYLGDGLLFALGIVLAPFIKMRYFTGFILAGVLTLVLVGFFKKVVFKHTLRPTAWVEQPAQELHLVPGVKNHQRYSFPSGHTSAAFAFWGFLALWSRRSRQKFLYFVMALTAAYSRIYLAQHFLEDILAGSALGFTIAGIAYFYSRKGKASWLDKKVTLKKSNPLV